MWSNAEDAKVDAGVFHLGQVLLAVSALIVTWDGEKQDYHFL